jgi:hypothetical protein
MSYSVDVFRSSNFDTPVFDALEWALSNCPSYITNTGKWEMPGVTSYYTFIFGTEEDAVLFTLRWI